MGGKGRQGKASLDSQSGMGKWHKKPFCAVLCRVEEQGRVEEEGGRQLCSNDIYFIRKFRLADVSKHPDSSYFLCFCVCLMLNACHLTVIAFAAIKQPQRQGLDFETPTRDDEQTNGRRDGRTNRRNGRANG